MPVFSATPIAPAPGRQRQAPPARTILRRFSPSDRWPVSRPLPYSLYRRTGNGFQDLAPCRRTPPFACLRSFPMIRLPDKIRPVAPGGFRARQERQSAEKQSADSSTTAGTDNAGRAACLSRGANGRRAIALSHGFGKLGSRSAHPPALRGRALRPGPRIRCSRARRCVGQDSADVLPPDGGVGGLLPRLHAGDEQGPAGHGHGYPRATAARTRRPSRSL